MATKTWKRMQTWKTTTKRRKRHTIKCLNQSCTTTAEINTRRETTMSSAIKALETQEPNIQLRISILKWPRKDLILSFR
jgi:hypothetical protein